MPNKQNIVKHRYKKGQSGNPKGRPPKLCANVLKELKAEGIEPVTMGQIKDIYESLINAKKERLVEFEKDKEQPILIRIIIKQMLSGKGFDVIERLLNRAQGTPKQSIDHNITGDKIEIEFDIK